MKKLLNITSNFHLAISCGVLVIGCSLFYLTIRQIIDEEVTEELYQNQAKVVHWFHQNEHLPPHILLLGDSLHWEITTYKTPEILKDTNLYNYTEQEIEPYRQLSFTIPKNKILYRVTLYKLLIENQPIISSIAISMSTILAMLFLAIMLINRRYYQYLWQPFYNSLSLVQKFQLADKHVLSFPKSNIAEFDSLNNTLSRLLNRINNDYLQLKEFTENASHEIQTPMAIIQAKIEVLMQESSLTESQLKNLLSISEAVNRLSKLNATLLLLTKIENGQFQEGSIPVNLSKVLEQKLFDFDDFLSQFYVQTQIEPAVEVNSHPILLDILINNLLSNAYKHNQPTGTINVFLNQQHLSVSNTGHVLSIPEHKIFERFQKGNTSNKSFGLGLAIAKKICEQNHWEISYQFQNNKHSMTVYF
jgi:signal transduction histidine kinase